MTPEATPPRRESDPEDADYRPQRQRITGDEVQLGVGRYSLTLRGSMVISVVMGLALLIAVGYLIRENDRDTAATRAQIEATRRATIKAIHEGMGLQTCVLALNAEERKWWRESKTPREAREWLVATCPNLLQAPEPAS